MPKELDFVSRYYFDGANANAQEITSTSVIQDVKKFMLALSVKMKERSNGMYLLYREQKRIMKWRITNSTLEIVLVFYTISYYI